MRIGLGIGLNRFRGAGVAITGLLDQYTGAAAAFSLDTLIYGDHSVEDTAVGSQTNGSTDTYTVRVRRSSDNAVRSFTHTEVGNGTLVTWVGAGNDGFVEAWYNQGSASDAVQATAVNQPKIVDAGSLVVENGKAALDFDGANDDLNISVPITSGFSFFGIYKNTQDGSYLLGNLNAQFGRRGTSEYRFHVTGSFSTNGGVHSNNQVLFTGIEDTVNATIYANGIQQSQSPSVFSSDTLTLISRAGIVGNIQEIIIFDSDQSSNRPAIESALNDYYEIY